MCVIVCNNNPRKNGYQFERRGMGGIVGGDMGRGWREEKEVEILINILIKKFKISHSD